MHLAGVGSVQGFSYLNQPASYTPCRRKKECARKPPKKSNNLRKGDICVGWMDWLRLVLVNKVKEEDS